MADRHRVARRRRIVDSPGREEVVSAKVYVTVTDERRGAVSTGWRRLALAIAILATAAVLLVTSLPSGRGRGRSSSAPVSRLATTARSTQLPPTASTSSTSCVDAAGYGGLGGRASAFDANNNDSTGPAEPSPGTAWYVVTATARGCVTAFSVQDGASPPLTGRDLLFLVSHPYLPRGAKQLVNTNSCAVWKSEITSSVSSL